MSQALYPAAGGLSAVPAGAGKFSGRLSHVTETTSQLLNDIPIGVRPGEMLTLSGMVQLSQVEGQGAAIKVTFYGAQGQEVGSSSTILAAGTHGSTRFSVPVSAPAGAVTAKVAGVVDQASGDIQFDDLQLAPRSTTTLMYDAQGNYVTSTTSPGGDTSQCTWDAVGNLLQVQTPRGLILTHTYDNSGRPLSTTSPDGTSRFEYDPLGQLTAFRDARSSTSTDNTYKTSFSYTPLLQLAARTDPLGRSTTWNYDDAGNLSKVLTPNGAEINYAYDPGNRLAERRLGTGGPVYSFSYNTANDLTQVTDSVYGSYQHNFDGAHRLTAQTDPFGYRQDYTLNPDGQVTTATDSTSNTVQYSYGVDGRLLSVTDPGARVTQYRYDATGRPFEVIRGNGLKSVILYDSSGRVVQIADPGVPNSSVMFYEYDQDGNITAIRDSSTSNEYTYDTLNRLIQWRDKNGQITIYRYDAVGNLLQKGAQTFTYDAANQITNPGFTHDADGNLTSDGRLNYQYVYIGSKG